MKRLGAFLLLAAAPFAFGAMSDEAAVRAVLREWLDALARNDLATVERIVADDYVITAAGGKVMNKTEDLAELKSGEIKFVSAEASDVKVRLFGNTAVVIGAGKYVVDSKGKRAEFRERFTDVYVKRGGRWQPVASHTTPIKAISAPPSP